MNNIGLRVFWTNSPMPLQQKVKKPEFVLDMPFGNVLIGNTGTVNAPVRSVNSKIGHVVLNAEDVQADQKGSANIVKDLLSLEISQVKSLAETNQLNITKKVDLAVFEQTQIQVESNRLTLLNKVDIQALAQLALLVDTKADQSYVQQQIANLVGSAPEALDTIYELATALQNNQTLLESFNQSVANRVRFDVATQVLTALQKSNARVNIGAEEVGTAAQLIAQITVQSIGAATAAQGTKAVTALQSADVAPVALSGLFSSLAGQNKVFDIVFSAYADSTNTVITTTDSLGIILGKLQAQIKALNQPKVNWIDLKTIATFNAGISLSNTTLQIANINGDFYLRGNIHIVGRINMLENLFTIYNKNWYVVNRADTFKLGLIRVAEAFSSSASIFEFYMVQIPLGNSLEFRCTSDLSSGTNIFFYIPPTNFGKLVNQ